MTKMPKKSSGAFSDKGHGGKNDGLQCAYSGEEMTAMRMREIGGGEADKTPAKNPGNMNYAYGGGTVDSATDF